MKKIFLYVIDLLFFLVLCIGCFDIEVIESDVLLGGKVFEMIYVCLWEFLLIKKIYGGKNVWGRGGGFFIDFNKVLYGWGGFVLR